MGDLAYRTLLRLLPRRRRERYGAEMTAVFGDLRDEVSRRDGPLGVAILWMKESRDLLRSAARDRIGRKAMHRAARSPRAGRGPGPVTELRWAWRGVRARGWRFGMMVALAAVTLAANATMFAVTDALVFSAFPFPEPDRIVVLEETLGEGARLTREQAARRLDEWARQADIFSATGGYQQKTLFLTSTGVTERTATADITVGFLDVLGVQPRWGRGFAPGDELGAPEFAVLIGEDLARRVYGGPDAALGQVLEATAAPHRIVGVMDSSFAFPSAQFEIWRAYDPLGPLSRNFGSISMMGRLAPGLAVAQAQPRLTERAPAVGAALGVAPYAASATPFVSPGIGRLQQTMLLVLLGAALSLLLAACANIASLELASAIGRSRVYAVQLALGAPRASLARVAAMEGALLMGIALVSGIALASLGRGLIAAEIPNAMLLRVQNRVDIDVRAMSYAAVVACVAWLLAVLPTVIAATRGSLLALLRREDRATAVSRAAVRLRRTLTIAQVSAAVALIITGLLYARSYRALTAIDKGFDSSGIAQVSASYPADFFDHRPGGRFEMADEITARLTALPGVAAATQAVPPPAVGDSPSRLAIEVDDRPPLDEPVLIGANWIDPSYFDVVRLPLREGRYLAANEQSGTVVVPATFARRFWPGESALGHRFRLRPTQPWNTVVGVVDDFRIDRLTMPSTDDRSVFYYATWDQIPRSIRTPAPRPADWVDTGGSWGFVSLLVRMDSPSVAPAILDAVRSYDSRLRVTLESIDEIYARQNADSALAATVVSAFSALAFAIAIVGVYGVMAFLVVGRRREIGIRVALGADASDVRRLVLASSVRLVLVGALVGAILGFVATRWIESQLYGVSATDPSTYLVVVAAVLTAALVATWLPSQKAARIEPAITLRAE